jgi:hypothetical protein
VQFTADAVHAKDSFGNIVLSGTRVNSLYVYSPQKGPTVSPPSQCFRVISHRTQAERVAFYHAAMGSPAIPTFIACIRRGYITLPGLTASMISRNLPNPIAMSRGHLDALRQNLRSTKTPLVSEVSNEPDPEYSPTAESLGDPTPPGIMCRIVTNAQLFADATGRFPVTTRSGVQYVLVFYCESSNYIHAETMTDRSGSTYLAAITNAVFFLNLVVYV